MALSMLLLLLSVVFALLSTAQGFATGVVLERSRNSTRTVSCSTPCEGLIGDHCTFGAAETHQPAPNGTPPASMKEALRAVASEQGDVHCRAFAEWKYGVVPSDCLKPVGNRTSIVFMNFSTKLPLLAHENAGAEADGATYETADVATTTALPMELITSPMMQQFAASPLMRRERKSSLVGKQTGLPNVILKRQKKSVAPNSSIRHDPTSTSKPKLLLRRETTNISFKEHLDFFMNVLRSAALFFFLVSALGALGGGVVKLLSPDERATAEVAPVSGNRDTSPIREQNREEASTALE